MFCAFLQHPGPHTHSAANVRKANGFSAGAREALRVSLSSASSCQHTLLSILYGTLRAIFLISRRKQIKNLPIVSQQVCFSCCVWEEKLISKTRKQQSSACCYPVRLFCSDRLEAAMKHTVKNPAILSGFWGLVGVALWYFCWCFFPPLCWLCVLFCVKATASLF